eukprot:s6407_g1.t1
MNEQLEASRWNLWVDLVNLSNEGITDTMVNGGTWPLADAIPHPSILDPQGRHGQEEVLGPKRSVEGSCGDGVEDDELNKQCEEERCCPQVKDAGCGDVWNGGIWSGVTGYVDGKVSVDDGEEVNGDEESISWLRHAVVVWESEGSGQREWNVEPVAVEGEMEGQQGPKWKVAQERWEEDGMGQEWE